MGNKNCDMSEALEEFWSTKNSHAPRGLLSYQNGKSKDRDS